MKKYTLRSLLSLLLLAGALSGIAQPQVIQASISPSPGNPLAVDVFFKPSLTDNTHYFDNLSITVAIPVATSTGSTTAAITTGSINPITWNSTAATAGGNLETAPGYTNYRFYVFTGIGTSTPLVSLTANTPIKVATITFSADASGSPVYLSSLDAINGGITGQGYTYIQMSGGASNNGQVSPDPTSGGTLFYTNGASQTIGSYAANSPWVNATSSLLPIRLTGFDVIASGCTARLSWATDAEVDLERYELEYSSDGVHFAGIGTISPKGDRSSYSFTHQPAQGNAYYRLHMTYRSGTTDYSKIVTTKISCNGAAPAASVYPVPAKGGQPVTVSLQGYKGAISGRIYNAAGALIGSQLFINGTNSVNTARLASGVYQLVITDAESNTGNFKIVVTR